LSAINIVRYFAVIIVCPAINTRLRSRKNVAANCADCISSECAFLFVSLPLILSLSLSLFHGILLRHYYQSISVSEEIISSNFLGTFDKEREKIEAERKKTRTRDKERKRQRDTEERYSTLSREHVLHAARCATYQLARASMHACIACPYLLLDAILRKHVVIVVVVVGIVIARGKLRWKIDAFVFAKSTISNTRYSLNCSFAVFIVIDSAVLHAF